MWQLSTNWANSADDLRVTNWARRFINYWQADNTAKGLGHPFIYAGDAGEFQDLFEGYPLDSVKRMKAIRDIYDSEDVFTRLNWGGFKLGNA